MSISVLINGTERKDNIDRDSFQKEDNLTAEVDVLEFTTRKYGSGSWKPAVGDEVVAYDGATKVFGGHCVEVDETVDSAGIVVYKATCKDYSHLMDGKLVFKEYENYDVEDIIADIVAVFLPAGFTTANVGTTGIQLSYILFNYEQPSKCLQTLAELIGWDWYVDANKDIHFFDKAVGETAPFDLTDDNDKYVFNSLEVKEDNTQIRNVVYVRGGEYAGDSRSDKVGAGDGTTTAFKLPYRYNSKPTVTVGGSSKTVGVDFLNDPAAYDCLWNYQEKILKFTAAPASGDVVVTGTPMIVVLVKASLGASIAVNGTYEYVVVDKTIITKAAARQRAQAEMEDYGFSVKDASFETYVSGLRSGQKINISSVIRGLNQDFIVTRVTSRMRTENAFSYEVECSTVRKTGIISFLQDQIAETNKKVGVFKNESEIIDVVINIEDIDTYAGTDSILRAILNSPPTWVAGPYYPTSDSDRTRAPYANTGAVLAS
jgi:hypothetical protein